MKPAGHRLAPDETSQRTGERRARSECSRREVDRSSTAPKDRGRSNRRPAGPPKRSSLPRSPQRPKSPHRARSETSGWKLPPALSATTEVTASSTLGNLRADRPSAYRPQPRRTMAVRPRLRPRTRARAARRRPRRANAARPSRDPLKKEDRQDKTPPPRSRRSPDTAPRRSHPMGRSTDNDDARPVIPLHRTAPTRDLLRSLTKTPRVSTRPRHDRPPHPSGLKETLGAACPTAPLDCSSSNRQPTEPLDTAQGRNLRRDPDALPRAILRRESPSARRCLATRWPSPLQTARPGPAPINRAPTEVEPRPALAAPEGTAPADRTEPWSSRPRPAHAEARPAPERSVHGPMDCRKPVNQTR